MRNSDRIYAVAGTVVVHLILLLVFLFSFLRYPPKGVTEWPPASEREIVFEEVEDLYASGEFVRTGDNLDELSSDEPAPSAETFDGPTQDGPDADNAGKAADPKPTVTSEQPSPAKVQKTPKGPTKEELAAEKARQEAKKQQQARKTAEEATKKAFGGGKGSGKAGQPDGNSANGATSGQPGNGVAGRTLESWGKVSSTKIGEIAIRVRVGSDGRVISASFDPSHSNGPVAADVAMRRSCEQKSLQCRFSVVEGAPVASGIITWRFK